MLIESLIKRKGGTEVSFGHPPKEVVFRFKPESDDIDARHVCEIDESKFPQVIQRLLAISECFRIAGANYESADEADLFGSTSGAEDEADRNYADQFENLHAVDPDAVDGKFLAAFARQVLEVPPANKKRIAEMLAKEWGVEAVPSRETANSLIRMALAECVKEAKAEAEQIQNMR